MSFLTLLADITLFDQILKIDCWADFAFLGQQPVKDDSPTYVLKKTGYFKWLKRANQKNTKWSHLEDFGQKWWNTGQTQHVESQTLSKVTQ